ncbi:putative NAD(P)H nitroreductase [Rossellomorea marisflavi]
MTGFTELMKERRSASNFLPDYPIQTSELNEIFELVKLSPSAFNLQHTRYIVVTDERVKVELQGVAMGQHKVRSASAVVLLLGDKKAYQSAEEIYRGLKMLKIVNEEEFSGMVENTTSFYEGKGSGFQRDEAIRNASLSSMVFMLAAKEKGWDTCPMIGFDPEKVKEILNIDDQYEVVMMISVGKEKRESRKPRGYRKPVSEFVTYI